MLKKTTALKKGVSETIGFRFILNFVGTSISLLEAQAATGRIIDPRSAEKMSVGEATQKRLIDRQFEAVLLR